MLMKNMELFDKLSIRLNNRIVFIKDVTGSEEICCWSFYSNGQKVSEICCTSIVYATERKQNKVEIQRNFFLIGNFFLSFQVEFFEARIYEETLNLLIYENRNNPVDELIRITTSRFPVAHSNDEDFDDERSSASASNAPSGRTVRKRWAEIHNETKRIVSLSFLLRDQN